MRILDAVPQARRRRGHGRVQPRLRRRRASCAGTATTGVTRISLGVQSTQPHVLAALGRTHDRANVDARRRRRRTPPGIPTFNLDLIAGTAGESDDRLRRARSTDVLALDPPHVSVYGLMVEPGTPLERRIAAGAAAPPDPDEQADRYLRADERLAAAGLEWYEVSNWARPGHECRHNLGYWTGQDCVAIGAAAHGHTRGVRWWNVRTPERYVERDRGGGESPAAGEERLDPATRASRAVRPRPAHPGRGAGSPHGTDPAVLAELVERRAGRRSGDDRIVLTPTGRLLATEVTLRLLRPPSSWHSIRWSANRGRRRSRQVIGRPAELDERKAAILRAIVEEYVETAQPVGSQTVARSSDLGVSSATIRNDMTVLEREGYIAQPHTSAGRIPTDLGYRYFVDHFAQQGPLPAPQRRAVSDFFASTHRALEELLHETSQLLARVSRHAAMVVGPPPDPAHGPQRPARAAARALGAARRRALERRGRARRAPGRRRRRRRPARDRRRAPRRRRCSGRGLGNPARRRGHGRPRRSTRSSPTPGAA